MKRVYARRIVWLTLLEASCAFAFALDPSLDVSQYAHTAWRVRDGFVKDVIISTAQTPDGYLWLGTELGLLRFDGVRAVQWQPPDGKPLPSNYIGPLLAAHDGTLWIGSLKGLASYKDGKLTQYPEVAGSMVGSLLEDRGGKVWFGTVEADQGRLCAIQAGKVDCYGAGSFGRAISALYQDQRGNLWVAGMGALWRWAPGPPQRYTFPRGEIEVNSLIEDTGGALLLAANDGLKQLVGGQIQRAALPGIAGQFRPSCLFRTSDGTLWIGTEQGLLHLRPGRVDVFKAIDGLSGDTVTRIFEDREGNVWVSTEDGLDRFREFAVPTISSNQGLSGTWSVEATPDGSIWMGTPDGLDRWENGHVTSYHSPNALGQSRQRDERELRVSGHASEIANSRLPGITRSLGLDDGKRLWASTGEAVFYFEHDRFVRVPGVPGGNIFSIAGDGRGNMWIVNSEQGLFYWTSKGSAQQIPWSRFGQKWARTSLPDPLRGGIWLGFFEGGIAYLRDGEVRASYGAADGLGDGRVTHLRFGSRGALWAATQGGLSRIKDGHIATLTSKNGLPCDEVHWSIEDDDHAVWLYMPCGLVRIARSELDAWVRDPKHVVITTVFDNSDGVRSVGVYGSYGPHVTKSPDGKIWFIPRDGVSIIDPHHLPFNKLPPPVHVEQITADGKTYNPSSGLRLPPHVRNLEINYTALSYVAPEKVHFRYQLAGLDRDWQDVGNRRQAFYTNLPPGHFRFRVAASNNSGVWNEEGASLDFAIAPAYYQTNWFRALCVVASLALLGAAYQLRVRQLRDQKKKLRDVIETIPTFAWTALPDGSDDFVNRYWQEYTGFSTEHSVGSGWQDAVHPADLARHLEKWHTCLVTGQPLESEVRYRRADGQYRWFMVRAVPLRDRRGRIVRWYGISTDIEERKRAEQERETLRADLAHVNRVSVMGELAASLSHELKQPITAGITNANTCLRWLARDEPDLDEVREAAKRIVQDGSRAAEIIDRIRSLYKKSPPKRELVDVNEIIREMVVLLRSEANRYAVSMRTELAADVPKITADRVQLQQVFMNLMLNAIEAMKETGGVLTLNSQLAEAGQLLISVSDTGVGLPTENPDEIFTAFFTTKPQGSGMGLAISRSIVESHGGRLWASASRGRGATFHFTLQPTAEELKVHAG